MTRLELKIPPPAVALAFGIGMWLVAGLLPRMDLPLAVRVVLAIALALIGQGISISGMVAFRKARTTINPVDPTKASSLVARGIFRTTRNPMYVGLTLTLLGWAAYLASPVAVVLVAFFVLYITRFQIVPEERVLQAKFGQQYDNYRKTVRRWI